MSLSAEPEDMRYSTEVLVALWAAARRSLALEDVLTALYEHEINVGMQSFWDGGWTVWIGDEMNGRIAEGDFFSDAFHEIPQWLVNTADRLFPALRGDA